jgi:hypothetical protein
LFASTDVDQLKLQEKAEVRKICEERLQSYIAKRGLGIWDYRMRGADQPWLPGGSPGEPVSRARAAFPF